MSITQDIKGKLWNIFLLQENNFPFSYFIQFMALTQVLQILIWENRNSPGLYTQGFNYVILKTRKDCKLITCRGGHMTYNYCIDVVWSPRVVNVCVLYRRGTYLRFDWVVSENVQELVEHLKPWEIAGRDKHTLDHHVLPCHPLIKMVSHQRKVTSCNQELNFCIQLPF